MSYLKLLVEGVIYLKLRINRELCLRCGACVGVCPNLALELTEHGIVHNPEKCKYCKICEKACPVGAIKVQEK